MIKLRTCVVPDGRFVYGIHKPKYRVTNLRQNTVIEALGHSSPDVVVDNRKNFPTDDVEVENADWIFEIPNPFPFKGATYIDKEWADSSADNYARIRIPEPEPTSFSEILDRHSLDASLISKLPEPMLLSLATCSTDPRDLVQLAELSCAIEKDQADAATGLTYTRLADGRLRPVIHRHLLFEAVANNPHLPDDYKIAMVIRPGAQGGSEIVGEWPRDGSTHVYEYLRRNSYIGGGHYAANMAEDAIRYSIDKLAAHDISALRHLYYQRTYVRLAEDLGLPLPASKRVLTRDELETLRRRICTTLEHASLPRAATLWGWNFGFDYAPSRYRLHASHQQIHQQYAMIPETVDGYSSDPDTPDGILPAYGCGDLVAELIERYREAYGSDFFHDYRRAIESNRRMDGRSDLDSSLVVWQDERVMLFVPKAQTSQWELQMMTKPQGEDAVAGNILEADTTLRSSLDRGMLQAQKALAGLGARMVTSIEYPKRLGVPGQGCQPLLYIFLPRLPESPGAFSEAQLRFINGHYPEDFAAVCRKQLG